MRKRQLVDHETQSSFVIQLCIHWTVFVSINVLVLAFWLKMFQVPGNSDTAGTIHLLDILIPFLMVSGVLLPIFILDSVRLSHRLVGPILKLKNRLKEIAQGKSGDPLTFRENDFWKSLAEDFNRAFDSQKTESTTASSKLAGK